MEFEESMEISVMYEQFKTRFLLFLSEIMLFVSDCDVPQNKVVYALGGVDAVAAPILSSVCVVSLVLSRIFLKEKLSWKTYAFITVVIIGILLLAVAEEL